RGTAAVSLTTCGIAPFPPGLHTKVPVTAVTGPGVPLKGLPLITSPSTSKEAAPVERFTRARPLRAVHGNVPLSILPTGLLTFGELILPTMPFQRTTSSP